MMKKGLCLVLSAAFIALSFAACGDKVTPTDLVTTKTNADGESYVIVTDKNGENVTNKNGEVVTSVLSDKEKSEVAQEISKAADKASEQVGGSNTENTKKTDANNSQTTDATSIAVTAAPEDLMPEGNKTNKTNLRDTVIASVIKKGKFTMVANIISGGTKTPATIAMNDKNLAVEMTVSSMAARVLLMDNKMYFALPATKMYGELSNSEFGDLNQIASINDTQTYVETTTVKDGSESYTCEKYKNEEGSISKYYFIGKTWKKWEIINDTESVVFEVTSFKDTVDANIFSLTGYSKVDLSGLAAQ